MQEYYQLILIEIVESREVWISKGRIACIKKNGDAVNIFNKKDLNIYDVNNNILAPGLIDPHMHIESSMMTACAYAEAALLNGTTTIFCDSHEIGNVCDVEGIEWMLEDCRQAPLSIFLTLPSTIPATNDTLETCWRRPDIYRKLPIYLISGQRYLDWVKKWILFQYVMEIQDLMKL